MALSAAEQAAPAISGGFEFVSPAVCMVVPLEAFRIATGDGVQVAETVKGDSAIMHRPIRRYGGF